MKLLFLFIAIPLIEIALFIKVGGWLTLWPTLAIVVATAFIGSKLVKSQGISAMAQVRGSFSDLKDPTEPLANGIMILFAGALLLTPGFFTDAVGFLLLFPPFRAFAFGYIKSRMNVQAFSVGGGQNPHHNASPDFIDGDFTEVNQKKPPSSGTSGWTKD